MCLASAQGGGGGLGLEKGTDCGPTYVERWLSRYKMAKKSSSVLLLWCMIGELSESLPPISLQPYAFKSVLETFQNNHFAKYNNAIQEIHHLTWISMNCSWVSMKKGGC